MYDRESGDKNPLNLFFRATQVLEFFDPFKR